MADTQQGDVFELNKAKWSWHREDHKPVLTADFSHLPPPAEGGSSYARAVKSLPQIFPQGETGIETDDAAERIRVAGNANVEALFKWTSEHNLELNRILREAKDQGLRTARASHLSPTERDARQGSGEARHTGDMFPETLVKQPTGGGAAKRR